MGLEGIVARIGSSPYGESDLRSKLAIEDARLMERLSSIDNTSRYARAYALHEQAQRLLRTTPTNPAEAATWVSQATPVYRDIKGFTRPLAKALPIAFGIGGFLVVLLFGWHWWSERKR